MDRWGTYIYHDLLVTSHSRVSNTHQRKGVEELYHSISKVNEMKAKAKAQEVETKNYGNQEE
jgi:hypothetical protein